MKRKIADREEGTTDDKTAEIENGLLGKWTRDEDNLLRDGVKELGNHWAAISQRIKGRSGNDCHHRWDRSLKPDIVKGFWSAKVFNSLPIVLMQLIYHIITIYIRSGGCKSYPASE